MSKYVQKSDLENKELEKLPIRRGCYTHLCACIGTCINIVGYVDREEYETLIKNFKSLPSTKMEIFKRLEINY